MTDFDSDRRKLLKAGGASLAMGLAGCIGPFADTQGVPGTAGDSEDGGDGGEDGGDGGGMSPQEKVDQYLAEANGYEGEVMDMTGQDSVTIENGSNEPDYAFGPAAIQVDPGTEITWEWVSDGHSVRATEGAEFDSGIENSGFTWSKTFEEPGVILYECQPHAAIGQLGAIIVGDGGGGGGGGSNAKAKVDEYLADANGYDGSIADKTGQDAITIENGSNEPDYAFGPAAVRVDAGTEITWEWVSDGHSVRATEGAEFDSGIENSGFTWSKTFEEPGVILYECQPHAAIGQLGAIIVEGEGSSGDGGDGGDGGGEAASQVDEYLADANGYDGSIEDMKGMDAVTIENGANEPDYAFGPAAVRISPGTEVTWEWVSDGHSVTANEGGDFDSGIKNSGFTWSKTFEEPGVILYECLPHAAIGQLGAIIVEE
ncbi:halocyanin domain-containing protein [Halovenus aranensis]|uniref:Halocyanin domain-containing protein n=1 Tax=Halovenus aranensis TaxID=890420 RepID=A0A1G8THR4_9EURY|nr:halocyanin domain-containing protein [Halovenus aranensis]SDJ40973.1 halocyanin domain-containing protein [Halovenus aranensis]